MASPTSATKISFDQFMATITAAPPRVSPRHRNMSNVEYGAPPDSTRVCRDGERTDHLVRLAGKYFGRGYRVEDVITLALNWNSRNEPPLEEDKVISTCNSIQQTHQRNHGVVAEHDEITPLFDLSSACVNSMLDSMPPPRRWLLHECLPIGKVGTVVAKGGTGKSQLMLQLAISVATGESLAGFWKVDEPGAVLALFAEDDTDEIHRRLHSCTSSMAAGVNDLPGFYQLLRSNLYIKSMVAERNLMTATNNNRDVVQTNYIRRLLLVLKDVINLRLIIVDPASRFRGGDENSAEDATRFVEALEELSKASGATVLVVHHMNKWSGKDAEQTQDAARGSSALVDGVRWQMNLAAMTQAEGKEYLVPEEERRNYLTATVTKNNYAAPQPKTILKRGDGGYLSRVALVSARQQQTQSTLTKVIDLIRIEGEAGRTYSKTAFEEKFGGASGVLEIGQVSLRKIIKDALKANTLVLQKGKIALPGRAVPKA
jgi:RecA-family ATPase